jgi:hypothetical protein
MNTVIMRLSLKAARMSAFVERTTVLSRIT